MQVPYLERKFLILIDAQSKWIEAFCIASATLATTMGCLHQGLEQFGIPEMVVTDSGTCFTSKEFEFFLEADGIRHLTSVPQHPAANGLAECGVQIVKQGLKKVTQGMYFDCTASRSTPQRTYDWKVVATRMLIRIELFV